MQDLIHDLQIAKRQTWEEKERLSAQYEEERKTNLANKGILEWVMDSMKKGNKELQEKMLLLQKEKDQLTNEYKEKRLLVDRMKEDLQRRIADYSQLADSGKATESETKAKVSAIHELKERLKRESDGIKELKKRLKEVQERQRTEREEARSQNSMLKGNVELRAEVEAEERRKLELENKAIIDDEMERMKMEIDNEVADIQVKVTEKSKEYSQQEAMQHEIEALRLKGEKSVVTLQIQTLKQEKQRLQEALDQAYKHHKEELEVQQLQNFQTFRNYRQVFEEQKAALEQRYRGLLEDCIQDSVFLSTRNSELVQENQALKQEIAEMKDKFTRLGGRPSTAGSAQ